MKKLLSMFLALLCLLSPSSVKGMDYVTSNTSSISDSHRNIDTLIKPLSDSDNEESTEPSNEYRICQFASKASKGVGTSFIAVGITLCGLSIRDKIKYNKSGWWKKTLAGLGLIVSGVVSNTVISDAFYKKANALLL